MAHSRWIAQLPRVPATRARSPVLGDEALATIVDVDGCWPTSRSLPANGPIPLSELRTIRPELTRAFPQAVSGQFPRVPTSRRQQVEHPLITISSFSRRHLYVS